MDARARVAWNMRRLRVARGASQEAFAVDAGIDRTYMIRIERRMENPTVTVLERIAAALGVEIAALFADSGPEGDAPRSLPAGRKRRKPG
ncbi:helix-turn-helix domain-containing protein [Acidocella sp.]|uniref:helix-turn-helix domain-containing protein n=1 Tax=Acidocella sp. TaxID=50710 RepID=UPI001807D05E|nr:helix-turn-helix transcriptional regulator [Acidocella sp.]NNM56783.1 helix-turn-helix transcriptional regulator [Acidocella sp.]